ncbi:hypothetical protein BU25DRAFT_268312 [Macroventuria anomochaeta]|uniref:Uncharacterized protein n=1 Tax=Macroventuria anomochaeta TaxID=301207 RepID=A0ACB6S6A9_9PLEO|nr:uncharacterized protein BU25DRAFT_268312 [Macroventuria anomochaeta]KAF2629518.1 hypothetical protein BU25DRAFT_268312 [Macroventuria anomochaeta]
MEQLAREGVYLQPNHQNQIHHWQERTSSEPEQQEQGVISRLFLTCQDSLWYLLQHLDATSISRSERNILRRSLASLQLWSDGHGATTGALDMTLDRSNSLRLTTLSILNPMCRVLSHGLRSHVLPRQGDDVIVLLCNTATELYSQTKWLLTDDNDDTSDSGSESSSSSDDGATDKMHELVQRIKTYTNCLIDLGTALDCPALEPEHDEGPSLVTLDQRSPHDFHIDLIRAKFPKAETCLLQSLGQTSWNRYLRMQQERDSNAHALFAPTSGDKLHAAESEFQNSGIGTSLPRVVSSCAETVVSSMASVPEGKRVNVPPLPADAKNGLPFECTACGKHIRATTNREWRKHLYTDLRPYTYLFTNCNFTREPFANRQLWTDHLKLGHECGPDWDAVQCPLCLDTTKSGKSAVLVHFARHLEDIALVSLPRDIESDTESDSITETETRSDNADEVSPGSTPGISVNETNIFWSHQPTTPSWQATVSTLKDHNWVDIGSGQCYGRQSTDGTPYLVVKNTHHPALMLLQTNVSTSQHFRKQQDKLISWVEGEAKMALSFQDAAGCTSVCTYLQENGADQLDRLRGTLASTLQSEATQPKSPAPIQGSPTPTASSSACMTLSYQQLDNLAAAAQHVHDVDLIAAKSEARGEARLANRCRQQAERTDSDTCDSARPTQNSSVETRSSDQSDSITPTDKVHVEPSFAAPKNISADALGFAPSAVARSSSSSSAVRTSPMINGPLESTSMFQDEPLLTNTNPWFSLFFEEECTSSYQTDLSAEYSTATNPLATNSTSKPYHRKSAPFEKRARNTLAAREARQKKSDHVDQLEAATTSNSNDDRSTNFQFIVGATPAEVKSKKNMTTVRKATMRAFLGTDSKGYAERHGEQ